MLRIIGIFLVLGWKTFLAKLMLHFFIGWNLMNNTFLHSMNIEQRTRLLLQTKPSLLIPTFIVILELIVE